MIVESWWPQILDLVATRTSPLPGTVTASIAPQAPAQAAERRVNLAYRIALGRQPSAKEMSWSMDALHQLTDRYRGARTPPEEANLKALAAVCHTLLNTNEFLYVE